MKQVRVMKDARGSAGKQGKRLEKMEDNKYVEEKREG